MWLLERYIPSLPFFAAFFFFSCLRMFDRDLVGFSLLVPCVLSFVFYDSFPFFFSTFVFLSSCPCFFSHEGSLAFCARSVRATVVSLTCLSYPRGVVFLRYFLSLDAIAALFASLLTPRLLNWVSFKFRGFVCACAFILRFC